MAEIRSIATMADWQSLLTGADPVLLFKHSTRCPISSRAHRNFVAWAGVQPNPRLQIALVRVIEERPISQQIALETGVVHQSPQAMLLNQGKVIWHASHDDITEQSLAAAVSAAHL